MKKNRGFFILSNTFLALIVIAIIGILAVVVIFPLFPYLQKRDEINQAKNAADALTFIKKRVFVTSTMHTGNLGGLVGADSICQTRANEAGLGGTWKAWLSDSVTDAKARLTHHAVPIYLVGGGRVANNWVDLTDGFLNEEINRDEHGMKVGAGKVWTGTRGDGSKRSTDKNKLCIDWTENRGIAGYPGALFWKFTIWTESNPALCHNSLQLYCMEQ